ncbi:MAG: hypothetical protein EXR71_09095 [Myxococcales bacterium]|nr:hypothetical protein [Myxococcales bacterium]
MDAFFARNRLSAYLDGELTAAEARDLETAVARDPALRQDLDELRRAVDLLRKSGIVDPPLGFADRLAARLEAEPMPVGWRRWVRQLRPEAVMLAAAAAMVVVYVGNRDELPNLTVPVETPVLVGKTFDNGAEAAVPESAPASVAAAPPPALEGKAAEKPAEYASAAADGVLGNEGRKPASKTQSLAERLPSPKNAQAGAEPWRAKWEVDPELDQATPPPQAALTSAQFVSPPPFRYRIVARNDLALKELARIAGELGGKLQDSRGRPLAAFHLEAGTSSSVRVAVPAHNAARLAERLRELGTVDALKETGNLLADPNADIPVQVELQLQ